MRSPKTPVLTLLLLFLAPIAAMRTTAQTVTKDNGFLNCYRRTRDIVLRSSVVAENLRTLEGQSLEPPVEADKLGWKFSFEQLRPDLADRLKTLLVSACLELYPTAKKDLTAPDFPAYLDHIIDLDRSLKTEGQSYGDIEMAVLMALLNQDVEAGENLGPILFTSIRTSLQSKVKTLSLDETEKANLSMVLSYPFGSLRFVTPHPFMKFSAAVFGSHDLSVQLRTFQSTEFLSMVVHESCHLNSRAATLREKPLKQLTDEDWTFLTLREEFRAGYVTMRFEQAWMGFTPCTYTASSLDAAHSGDQGLRGLFEGFTKSLRYVHPRQQKAVNDFLVFYSELTPVTQEKLLTGWLKWD